MTTEKTPAWLTAIGYAIVAPPVAALAFAFMVCGLLFDAWITVRLWAWYIVPIFGLAQITIIQAAGIDLTIFMFTKQGYRKQPKMEGSDWFWLFATPYIYGVIALAVGAFLKRWQ